MSSDPKKPKPQSRSWLKFFRSNEFLRVVQASTGLIFGSYLTVHLTSAISAIWGPFAYDEALNFFRNYYQARFMEPIILGSGLIHLTAGLISFRRRPTPLSQLPWPQRLHSITGLILTGLAVGHAFATRAPYYFLGEKYIGDASFVTHSIEQIPYWFYPYYIVLGFSGFYHFMLGLPKALAFLGLLNPATPSKISRSTLFKIMTAVGFGTAIMVATSFTQGVMFDIPRENYPLWDHKNEQTPAMALKLLTFGLLGDPK